MNCCAEDHDEIDELFDDETDGQFLASLCSKRFQEIKGGEFGTVSASNSSSLGDTNETWGYLSEIGHEKEVLHMSTHIPRLLIHFYNPSFKNCQLINEHLQVTSLPNCAMNHSILFLFRNWRESSQLPVSFSLKLLRLPF